MTAMTAIAKFHGAWLLWMHQASEGKEASSPLKPGTRARFF
jgi:hypothetical protein